MTIDYRIAPNGNKMEGLINRVKNSSSDLIGDAVYTETSQLYESNNSAVLSWSGFTQTANVSIAFIKISFKGLFLHPTHYMFKSYKGRQYAKKWDVYGTTIANKEILLSSDNSSYTGFCGSAVDCSTSDNYLYKLKNTRKTLVAIKWVPTLGSVSGRYYFLTGGIELFGRLSSIPENLGERECTRRSNVMSWRAAILCSSLIFI